MASNLFSPLSLGSMTPLHEQVAQAIRQKVRTGELEPGQWLPSFRDLAGQFGISLKVVHVAIQNLQAQGLVRAHHGKGAQIIQENACRQTAILFGLIHPYASSMTFYSQVIGAVEEAFARRNNFIVTQASGEDPGKALAMAEHLVSNGVRGLLLWPPARGTMDVWRWQALAEKVPLLLIDRPWESAAFPALAHDMQLCGQQVAERLLTSSYRGPLLVLQDDLDIWPYRQWLIGLRRQAQQMAREKDIRVIHLPISKAILDADLGRTLSLQPLQRMILKQIAQHRPSTIFCLQHDLIRYLIRSDAVHQAIRPLGVGIMLNRFPLTDDLPQVFPGIHGFAWRMNLAELVQQAADTIQHWVLSRKPAKGVALLDIPVFPF